MPDCRTNTEWLAYTIMRADECNKTERRLTVWKTATLVAVAGQLCLLLVLLIL